MPALDGDTLHQQSISSYLLFLYLLFFPCVFFAETVDIVEQLFLSKG